MLSSEVPADITSAIKLVRAEVDKLDIETAKEVSRRVNRTIEEITRTLSKPAALTQYERGVTSRAFQNIQDSMDEFAKSYGDIITKRQEEAGQLGADFVKGRAVAKKMELPSELFTPINVSRIEAMQAMRVDLVSELKEVSQRRIRRAIQRGVIEGSELGNTTAQIIKNIDSASTFGTIAARAETIARTETLRAYSVGHQIDMNRIAQVMPNIEKRWVSYIDDRTRESHVAVNGDKVKWNEYFTVGSVRLLIPRDPEGIGFSKDLAAETINCRCAVVMA